MALGDGEAALSKRIRDAIPLRAEQKQDFLSKFTIVIRATVKGDMLVALLQGTLGGLIFWFLGIGAPLLWGVVMAFFSLLPAIGAGLIWVPVAIYLLASGAVWQGVVLIAFGSLVIGLVDNFLRPILVGKDTKMPDYVVLVSTLGGIATFGLNGFVVGPVIAPCLSRLGTYSRRQENAARVTAACVEPGEGTPFAERQWPRPCPGSWPGNLRPLLIPVKLPLRWLRYDFSCKEVAWQT